MRWHQSQLLIISVFILVGCGGGSGGSSTSTTVNTPITQNLTSMTLVYSQTPRINQELKLSIEENTSSNTNEYAWKIINKPDSSNLQLNVSADSNATLLTPMVAGIYKITATSATGELIETQFSVNKDIPFNTTKLEGYDSTQELSKQTGVVSNQAWVYSESLSRTAIEAIVSNYNSLTILDFDLVRGLLIEFDDNSAQSHIDIDKVKATLGIDSVDSRVFAGQEFIHGSLKIAEDGSAFDDGGDNWHLEHIGIEQAWDISTGNSDFYIGIADSIDLFHTKHEDLNGRFKEATRAVKTIENEEYFDLSFHGTAVAGAIGAISNNDKGISGINWSNQIIAGIGGYEGTKNIADKDKVLLINNSWSITGYIGDEFEDDNPLKVENRSKITYDLTRDIRKLTIDKPKILFIFAAGNGVENGLGFSGFYGVDGRYDNPALQYQQKKNGDIVLAKRPNVLMVTAHLIDNRLAYYSNFGKSVDIAAPAGYKSTKNDSISIGLPWLSLDEYYTSNEYGTNTTLGSFKGTSSATPVVTGVASLILSVDQTFTPSEVKNILINSATEFVTERYLHPGNEDENYFGPGPVGSGINIETLSHPIPILNAAAALTMAKEIKKARDDATNSGGEVGILTPITPLTTLTTSESGVIPSNGTIPSISFLEETGFDGDIDQDLYLIDGVSSIQVVDVQRDFGVSAICEDGINKPLMLSSADYSTNTIRQTFYDDGQVAASCSTSYQSILPVTLSNSNITDVLDDWGSSPVSSDCPIEYDVPPTQTPSINTNCKTITLSNYLITDVTGKQHKISLRVTTDFVD